MKADRKNATNVFNVLVAETESNFFSDFKSIASECCEIFPGIIFNPIRVTDVNDFNINHLQKHDLSFIEDEFLLGVSFLLKPQKETDIVLLVNSHIIAEHAHRIKDVLTENSLNLTEHISVSNYNFNLKKIVVIDLVKSKLQQ